MSVSGRQHAAPRRRCAVTTVDNEVNRLWGEVNGKGRNMLGQLLMELRASLRGVEGGLTERAA